MPFNPQATYIGGQLIGQGLSNFGQNLGEALQQYHREHQQQIAADETALNLTQTPGYDGKPVLSKGAYERYMAASGSQHAAKLAGLLQSLQVGYQALGAYEKRLNINQPFLNVNGQLFRRPGAPLPVTQPGMLGEQGRQRRFDTRQNTIAIQAQNKLAENQIKQLDTSLADLGYSGDSADLLNSNLHKGGYIGSDKKFHASDPTSTDPKADKAPQTTIQIGGRDTLDKPTFDRAQRLAQQRMKLQAGINQNLQTLANPGGAGLGGGGGSGVVRVNSVAEAQRLPPGSVYLAPDGKKYRIPYPANTTATDETTTTDTTAGDTGDEEDNYE